jgi:predicted nucleic acid-binding protein
VSIGSLDAALAGVGLVAIDTSVWLAFMTTADTTHHLARHLFRRVAADDDPLRAEASMVTVTEALVRPARAGTVDLARMRAYLAAFPHLRLVPVELEIATTAAVVRARTCLKTRDALIVASAMVNRADAVVTNDDAWAKQLATAYPAIRWVGLRAHR